MGVPNSLGGLTVVLRMPELEDRAEKIAERATDHAKEGAYLVKSSFRKTADAIAEAINNYMQKGASAPPASSRWKTVLSGQDLHDIIS